MVVIPKVILQLISIYFYDWIKMAQIGYCTPPQLVIDTNNDEEYILISLKSKTYALSKYYEDTTIKTKFIGSHNICKS